MLKKTFFILTTGCALMASNGCSSVMSHTGPNQGYYPGTRASLKVIQDQDTSWAMVPLAALDLPFSAVLDTLLLPYDYLRKDSDKSLESPRERMLHGGANSPSGSHHKNKADSHTR
ncbi:YceK/YidQ family lipoprotein [Acerihabitans arboris]|uniref:YceK/YidQ family lipoprotein n=1 Tax=Acerihabitans arboris TaxID=2691583 RepID=A0A845SQ57_9GAMM|nr:YceK/YidQ family lipoprotein [Acerihabitans arboris]NDL64698.1 YceK/YidQ family lipoprotein [Acerihabitans arboris]